MATLSLLSLDTDSDDAFNGQATIAVKEQFSFDVKALHAYLKPVLGGDSIRVEKFSLGQVGTS